MQEIIYDSNIELRIENDRQRYLSLISFFVFTAFLFSIISHFGYYNELFRLMLLGAIVWLSMMLLLKCVSRKIGSLYLFAALIPLILLAPLFMLTMNDLSGLSPYNITLALYGVFIQFTVPMERKHHTLFQVIFITEYALVLFLHDGFGFRDYFYSGGFLLHILIVSLGISRHESESEGEKLRECRSIIRQYKNTFYDRDEGDPMLGIFNRSGGMKILKQMMKWAERYKIPLTVCYMELQESHDDYINTVSRKIFNRIRETDTLFRLGKSEMLLILPDCKKQNAAEVISYIQQTNEERGIKYGLADFNSEMTNSPNELIINANRASFSA